MNKNTAHIHEHLTFMTIGGISLHVFLYEKSPIRVYIVTGLFNEFPAISLSTPSLSLIIGYLP